MLAQQQRMVHRQGDRHRMQVGTLHKLARAAGLSLDDVYGERELAEAREHADARVDDRVRGWDLMLDLPKSDSVLPGLMSEADAREYRDLVHQAKVDTIRQVERLGRVRGRLRGRTAGPARDRWSAGVVVGAPVGTSDGRWGCPGDPHLHLHITIANMGLCEDGQWRSIANSGQDLHRHAAPADAYFKARVRALTHARFGVRRQQAERTGAWEVDGIGEPVRDLFSRRHGRIVDLAVTRPGARSATVPPPRPCAPSTAPTLRRCGRAGGSVPRRPGSTSTRWSRPPPRDRPARTAGPTVDGPGGPRIPPPSDLAQIVFHPETGLTASAKTFSRAQLLAAVGNALPHGLDADEVGRLDELVDDRPGRGRVRGTRAGLRVQRHDVDRPLHHPGHPRRRGVRTDQALTRHGEGRTALTPDQSAAAIDVFQVAVGFELSEEQRAAVTRLLTGGHGIDTIVGVAGRARARSWRRAGSGGTPRAPRTRARA
ncbi:relaxase domain-containing protein [Streptomyces sp. 11-1-2]|uniref:relaxase domain-containing protein n=1 Tax=Streptomyces sp. 11-1-2 TaxID=1851167 RepID=UPI000B8D5CF5|nr:relaxase domain-containing protein [Streptomyces sp. 11-1-2]ASR00834.1 hypothetical protein CGL27_49150 [Streptomyces sp. 11-1-2]